MKMNNVHVCIVMCDCNCAGLFYQNNIIQYKFKIKRDSYYAGNCRNII